MVKKTPSLPIIQAALADLVSVRPETFEAQACINEAIASLVRVSGIAAMTPFIGEQTPAISVGLAAPAATVDPARSPFYGMGLKEAVAKQLAIFGRPQTGREIWTAIGATGFLTNHHDPVHAVSSALKRRANTHGDLLLVGKGMWGLKAWYSDTEITNILAAQDGMPGRDRAEHVERTKEGMRIAKERGAHIGTKLKITAEVVARVRALRQEGYTVAASCKKVGISTAAYNLHKAEIESGFEIPSQRGRRTKETDRMFHEVRRLLTAGLSVEVACERVNLPLIVYHNYNARLDTADEQSGVDATDSTKH